jgi:hypothetical protein
MKENPGETTITTARYEQYIAFELAYRNLKEWALQYPEQFKDVLYKMEELEKQHGVLR